jgi:hypothetical protein
MANSDPVYILKKFKIDFFIAGLSQRKLLENLFRDYDPLERPVKNENDYVNITIGLALQQILDVVN